MLLNIYVQKVIAESDARGEDDLSGREAEVMRFQVALEGINGWGRTDFKRYWVPNGRS